MTKHMRLDGEGLIRVVPQDEAEKCDYVVCAPVDADTLFTDNLTEKCCECGIAVMIRPHSPKTPKRICLECLVIKIKEADEIS